MYFISLLFHSSEGMYSLKKVFIRRYLWLKTMYAVHRCGWLHVVIFFSACRPNHMNILTDMFCVASLRIELYQQVCQ